MHHYTAYGMTIASEYSLPELREHGPGDEAPDVRIETGSLTPVSREPDSDDMRRLDVGPTCCRLSYDDVGTFRIEDGERVRFDPVIPDVPGRKVFRRLLEGQVLAVVCHQRDRLVLHGSAVQVDGRAVVFLGPTGAGKSTTATACYEAGYPLLDDDVVVVRTDGATPTVGPGVPQLKLTDEMTEQFDIEGAMAQDRGVTGKTHYRTETAAVDPFGVPLAGCYLLREAPRVSVDPVTGHDAVLELITNTYTVGLLDETGMQPTNFEQCAAVAAATPVNTLSRPQDVDVLPDVVEAVADDVTADRALDRC